MASCHLTPAPEPCRTQKRVVNTSCATDHFAEHQLTRSMKRGRPFVGKDPRTRGNSVLKRYSILGLGVFMS
eukprot:44456-Eustigmatos_ZCMA.PRE.1